MIWTNSCPRCKQGAPYLDEDDSKQCLQCGYVRHLPVDPTAAIELARRLGLGRVEEGLMAAVATPRV